MKKKIYLMFVLVMILFIGVGKDAYANENEDISVPMITAMKRTPQNGIEVDTEIIYEITYEEKGSGIKEIMASFDLIGVESDGWEVTFFEEYEKEEYVGNGIISIRNDYREAGTYELRLISIMDHAGNEISYERSSSEEEYSCYINGTYTEDYAFITDVDDSFTVSESSKPIEERAIVLEDIRLKNNPDSIKAPTTLDYELSVKAPKNTWIYGISLTYCAPEIGHKVELVAMSDAFGESEWDPGTKGDTIDISVPIGAYMGENQYVLTNISFHTLGENMEYYEYSRFEAEDGSGPLLIGKNESGNNVYEYSYNGNLDFTVIDSAGLDMDAPVITSVVRTPVTGIDTKTKVTYVVKYEDEVAGLRSLDVVFENEDGKLITYDYFIDINGPLKKEGEVKISASKHIKGEYKLLFIIIEDLAGNVRDYMYSSEAECYIGTDQWGNEKQLIIADEMDDYTVKKPCSHTYKTEIKRKASFENEGIREKSCSKCKQVLTETIAKVAKAELSSSLYTYDGKVKKPTVILRDENGKKLSSSSYSVYYSKGRKLPGLYEAKVVLKGNYQGETPLTFIIQPKAPTSLKATLTDANAVKLTWKSAKGANGYHVYYRVAGEEEYTQVGGDVIDTEKEIAGLEYGVKYEFKVASDMFFGDDCCESTKYATTSTYTLKKVEDVKVERYSSSKVKVSWDNISGESGYDIKRIDSNGDETVYEYETTTGKSKTFTVPVDEPYQYEVRAFKMVGKTKIAAPWSETISFALRNVGAVKNVEASLFEEYNKVKVTWSEVETATGYKVSWKKGTGSYTTPIYTAETEYVIDELSDGAKYTIKVQPCYVENDVEVAIGTSDTATVYTLKKVTGVKVVKSSSKVKVRWTNISGESGYEIAQAESEDVEAIIDSINYKTTTGTYKTISADKGVTYYYRVRAYRIVGEEKIYGPWSDAKAYTRK